MYPFIPSRGRDPAGLHEPCHSPGSRRAVGRDPTRTGLNRQYAERRFATACRPGKLVPYYPAAPPINPPDKFGSRPVVPFTSKNPGEPRCREKFRTVWHALEFPGTYRDDSWPEASGYEGFGLESLKLTLFLNIQIILYILRHNQATTPGGCIDCLVDHRFREQRRYRPERCLLAKGIVDTPRRFCHTS